jgi:hypothetical protein
MATTSAGRVALEPARVSVVQADLARPIMQALHERALGHKSGKPAVDALKPRQAFTALSTAVASALGQIALSDAAIGGQILRSLCSYANIHGLAGLHALFFAAFASTLRGGETDETSQALGVWNANGVPPVLPGGALTMPLLSLDPVQVKLIGSSEMAGTIGPGPHTIESLSTGLSLLAGAGRPGTEGADGYQAALAAVAGALQASAIATASTIAVRQDAETPPAPRPLAGIAEALKTWLGPDFIGLPGPTRLMAEGKSLVVDIAPRSASGPEQPSPGVGAPLSLAPQFEDADAAAPARAIWRAKNLPGFLIEGAGADKQRVAADGGVTIRSLPVLLANGTLRPGELFKTLVPSVPEPEPPARPEPPAFANVEKTESTESPEGHEPATPTTGVGELPTTPPAASIGFAVRHDPLDDPDQLASADAFLGEEVVRLGLSENDTVETLQVLWAGERAGEA